MRDNPCTQVSLLGQRMMWLSQYVIVCKLVSVLRRYMGVHKHEIPPADPINLMGSVSFQQYFYFRLCGSAAELMNYLRDMIRGGADSKSVGLWKKAVIYKRWRGCHTYIYIYHNHQIALLAWISLTLSLYLSLSSITPGRSSKLHPMSTQNYLGKFLLVGKTSLMSLSFIIL